MKFKLALLVAVAIAVLYGAILVSGVSSQVAAEAILQGSFGSPRAVAGLLKEFTPLLLLGASVFLALRAGLFNIGADGQFLVGAAAAATVALKIAGPMGVFLAIIAGAAAGWLWAFPAGWIRAYRGGHEVITTIMLNNVANLLCTSLVSGPIKDPTQESTTTRVLEESSWLPSFSVGPVEVSLALPFAIVGLVAFSVWLARSVRGFELRAVGANPGSARYAGVSVAKAQLSAFAWSGAVAGLAGAVQVLAFEHRFYANFSPGYGFDALGIALLAGGTPLGVLPGAFAFGVLSKGATALSIEGVPKGITTIVIGLLIVIMAAIRYRQTRAHE